MNVVAVMLNNETKTERQQHITSDFIISLPWYSGAALITATNAKTSNAIWILIF